MNTTRPTALLILPFSVFCGLSAFLAESAEGNRNAINPVGQAFRDIFEISKQELRLLPVLENGLVTAVEPRSKELLQYLINDYTSRDLRNARAIHYCAVAGITNVAMAASTIGQFEAANKVTASYYLIIGSGIPTAELGRVLITIEAADGSHDTKTVVYWNKKSDAWSLLRSDGPSESPIAIQKLVGAATK